MTFTFIIKVTKIVYLKFKMEIFVLAWFFWVSTPALRSPVHDDAICSAGTASPNQIDWHELLDAELQYENVNDRIDD